MPTVQYRWSKETPKSFPADWGELTEVARVKYGATNATLYLSETGEYVATVQWPSTEAWQKWREEMANHPYRQKYRQYRVSGPEFLLPLIEFE